MKNNYVIAIPTYDRPKQVMNKTLAMLSSGNINKDNIYLFVSDENQKNIYNNIIPSNIYNQIVVGEIGIANQRNFITDYFSEDQYIVSIDDDVEELLILNENNELIKIHDLNTFFIDAFETLEKEKLFIWGVYPVKNPFFMKGREPTTTNLRFLIGVIHGYINRHSQDLTININAETKEDYERTILHYLKDGGVVRFNNVTFKTKFNAIGGLGVDRYERNKQSALYLECKYPDIITVFQRKNGTYEVRVKKRNRFFNY